MSESVEGGADLASISNDNSRNDCHMVVCIATPLVRLLDLSSFNLPHSSIIMMAKVAPKPKHPNNTNRMPLMTRRILLNGDSCCVFCTMVPRSQHSLALWTSGCCKSDGFGFVLFALLSDCWSFAKRSYKTECVAAFAWYTGFIYRVNWWVIWNLDEQNCT